MTPKNLSSNLRNQLTKSKISVIIAHQMKGLI
jgi:hypothetical protein